MFGFTRKTDYALVALASLAQESASTEAPQSARAISERYAVPLPLLMNVLKNLVGSGLITSTRGAKGGYALARPAGGISVHDVIEAIEGPISVTVCCDPAEAEPCHECAVEVRCPITHSVRHMNDQIQKYFHQITLEHLMREGTESFFPVSRMAPAPSLVRE